MCIRDSASGVKTSREAVGDLFSTPDMKTLIHTLDDIPDQMALRWLNAMLGRVFLAVAHTRAAEAGVLARLNRRIERMRFPRLLSDVKITSVDLGTAAPTFGRPILKKLTPEGEANPSAVGKLCAGAISGGVAQTCTYPLDVLRRRFQINTMSGMGYQYKSILDALQTIFRQEGFRGLYKGITPNLLKVAPSMASSWLAFETVRDGLVALKPPEGDEEGVKGVE